MSWKLSRVLNNGIKKNNKLFYSLGSVERSGVIGSLIPSGQGSLTLGCPRRQSTHTHENRQKNTQKHPKNRPYTGCPWGVRTCPARSSSSKEPLVQVPKTLRSTAEGATPTPDPFVDTGPTRVEVQPLLPNPNEIAPWPFINKGGGIGPCQHEDTGRHPPSSAITRTLPRTTPTAPSKSRG